MNKLLEVLGIDVGYGDELFVFAASLHLAKGEIGCLLGPSGCGKTTLLRAIAGFEPVRRGCIRLAGKEVSSVVGTVPPERRQVGMVFQDFALFPHLSVADNIAFGIHHWPASKRRARVNELLQLVGLPNYGANYPHALSGGQQQRVALARAMAPKPRLLLLDEPFSSLDVELREVLAREVRRILSHEEITGLLVTHDQNEAFATADRIAVMQAGHILQCDTPYNLYHQPSNRQVADFIGQGVLLPARVSGSSELDTPLGRLTGELPEGLVTGSLVDVLVRPDDLLIDPACSLQAEVIDKVFRGAMFLYTLRLPDGHKLLCQAHSHADREIGSQIGLRPDFDHLVVFPRDA
ncbi:MAG: ABC transporter ATP-binding protein [Thiohalomonadaceae bacterium]